MVGQIVV